jgi:hypothetical protein
VAAKERGIKKEKNVVAVSYKTERDNSITF